MFALLESEAENSLVCVEYYRDCSDEISGKESWKFPAIFI